MAAMDRGVAGAAASKSSGALGPGTRLQNRYEIVRVLGYGGLSTVYLGLDRRFAAAERRCAVKEMSDSLVDPQLRAIAVQNFEREANVLASLNHPAIPKIYDYFQQGERLYLVEELIEGEDLAYVLARRKGALPADAVVGWSLQIMDVLEYLHNHVPDPIVFRDLKPSNIMVTQTGRIVLVDFGIAKAFTGQAKGTMIGTDGYAAPEQYRGVAEPRTDIYGLGATLHHLLTGVDPREFPPFSWRERPIISLNPAVPEPLSTVIGRALEYRPEDRYATIADFRAAIRHAMAGTGRLDASRPLRSPDQPSPPRPDYSGPLVQRPPGQPAPSVRLTSTSSLPDQRSGVLQRDAGMRSQPEASGDVQLLWRQQVGDEVRGTACALGNYIYVGSYDNYLYCLLGSTGEVLWRYQTQAGVCSTPLAWGNLVYFGSEDGHIYVLNARTGALAWSAKMGAPVRGSPAIEGSTLICGADDGSLSAWEAPTGRLLWTFQAWDKIRSRPLVHEGYVYVGSHDRTFYCLDLAAGRVKWRYEAGQPITSSPVAGETHLYFGVMDGNLISLDLKSGWLAWRVRTDAAIVSTPCLVGTRVCVGSVDKHLWAFEAASGRVAWRYETEGQITSSPRALGDQIYVGGIDGAVYCINASGKALWRFPTGGPVPASPLLHDGRIIVGSCDRYIYALQG